MDWISSVDNKARKDKSANRIIDVQLMRFGQAQQLIAVLTLALTFWTFVASSYYSSVMIGASISLAIVSVAISFQVFR